MKRPATVAVLLVLASPAAVAQQALTVLQNNSIYRLQSNGRYDTTYEVLARIDDASAISANKEQHIRFNARLERARLVAAYIEHPNGKRHAIVPATFKLAASPVGEGGMVFRDDRLLSIPFPHLQLGDKLFYKVLLTQTQPTIPGQFFGSWIGPWPQPARYSITVDQPQNMKLFTQARGFRTESVQAEPGRTVTRWELVGGHNHLESGAANSSAFRDMLVVSTFGSYTDVARNYGRAHQRQVKSSPQLAALARSLVTGMRDQRSKALAIHAWIQRHIHYRALYFGAGAWLPSRSATSILRSRSGDCKDHAVLMEAMLAAVHLESTPAMINLGNDLFTLPAVAMPHFDHVITYIPALGLYLDATNEDVEGGYLAADLLDKDTLLVRSGALGHTPAHQAGQIVRRFDVQVQADGSALFSDHVNISGHLAETKRSIVRNAGKDESDGWLKTVFNIRGWTGTAKVLYENAQARHGDFRFAYTDGVIKQFVPATAQIAIPADSALVGNIKAAVWDAAVDATRSQPFRCEQRDILETATYAFPDNLTIDAIPGDVSLSNDYFDFSARYERTGQNVKIERHFVSAQRGSLLCTPQGYAAAADAVQNMRADMDGQIVLRRQTAIADREQRSPSTQAAAPAQTAERP